MQDTILLGIDVGSISVKFAVLNARKDVLYEHYESHNGRPLEVLYNALYLFKTKNIIQAGENKKESLVFNTVSVTGSAKDLICNILGVQAINEIIAQAYATHYLNNNIKTIIEIGGQDSKFIHLDKSNGSGGPKILTQKMNDICAAGTGSFIEQQAIRMGVSLEDFGDIANTSENPSFIAGRCAVFSKTDIIHQTQEGIPQCDIAAGICMAIVRNYAAQFIKGKKIQKPVIFQGGLAGNRGVVKAFKEYFHLADNEFIVPEHYRITGAIGAAFVCYENNGPSKHPLSEILDKLQSHKKYIDNNYLPCFQEIDEKAKEINGFKTGSINISNEVFIGIDIGSTSTCIALLNEKRELLLSEYLFNMKNVLESIKSALQIIDKKTDDKAKKITVSGIGVTGSGRMLIGKYFGSNSIKDEISAQAKAAVHMMPDVDTVIEIGGQDSKYIRIHNGQVADFEMNKICAAGTGYFLQEQADRLNIHVSEMSHYAFKSKSPCNLGSRCTVFMESDLINFQQQGIPYEDLISGISYSVVTNYLEKTVAGKEIGTKILFLGGVAFNKSIASAFKKILKKEIFIPRNHEISAALGMALFAIDESKENSFDKISLQKFLNKSFEYDISSFTCDKCTNICRISKVSGERFIYLSGGRCDKYELVDETKKIIEINYFLEREKLLESYHDPDKYGNGEIIGIPRAHMYYEYFPLYVTYLQELGYSVILSDKTSSDIVKVGLENTLIDNCYPCKIVYGHIDNLIKKGVGKIFYPSVIECERKYHDLERNFSCPFVQAMPSIIQSAYPEVDFLIPTFHREKTDYDWKKELYVLGLSLKRTKKEVKEAVAKSSEAYYDFREKREGLGKKCISIGYNKKICVLMGKVYTVCDPVLNLNLADKLRKKGVISIPFDCLPVSEQKLPYNYKDMVWASGQDFIRASKIILESKELHPVMVTNFGCGPDSFITKYKDELFRNRPSLTLEVDEHTSGVGMMTRIEAFLNNLKNSDIQHFEHASRKFQPFIADGSSIKSFNKLLYMPIGFDGYKAIGAAFQSIGVRIKYLPDHDEVTQQYGKLYTSGRECLPYIMHVGDAVRMIGDEDFNPEKCALFLPSSDLACRVAAFSTSIKLVLSNLGYPDFPVIAPRISVDNDEFLRFFGIRFAVNLFRGMTALELLNKLAAQIRPYEICKGSSDLAYTSSLDEIIDSVANNDDFWVAINNTVERFDLIDVDISKKKMVIGLVGDDYTRGNPYANNNIIKELEDFGVEVRTIPIWSSFLEFQMGIKPIKTMRRGRYPEAVNDKIKGIIGSIDIKKLNKIFKDKIRYFPEPNFREMMEMTSPYLDQRSEPLTIIALAHIINLINSGVDGIINLVGFQCMIHNVVLAKLSSFLEKHRSVPHLSLSFDFQEKGHHKNRIEAFLYQVGQSKKNVL